MKFLMKATGKITKIGSHRAKIVNDIVEEGVENGNTPEQIARKLKRDANTPAKKDQRNWNSVAITEMTDLAARDSLEDIIAEKGRGAHVYRITGDACEECLSAFGTPSKPRIWVAGRIPDKYQGAVHTNCRCSPWDTADAVRKSKQEMIGMVKNENDKYSLFDGENWIDIDSIDAKRLIKQYLLAIPIIMNPITTDKYIRGNQGYLRGVKKYYVVNLQRVSNVIILPSGAESLKNSDVNDKRIGRGLNRISLDDYLNLMSRAIPHVAKMPEYWEHKKKRHLSCFLGFGSVTDYSFLLPSHLPKDAILETGNANELSPRRAAVINFEANLKCQYDKCNLLS